MRFDRREFLLLAGLGPGLLRHWARASARPPAGTDGWTFPSCGPLSVGAETPGPIRALYVPAKDGTQLALDLVLPDVSGAARSGVQRKRATILIMGRYWRGVRGAPVNQLQRFYASHGYAVVIGDVRGTGASFGVWPYHRSRAETRDFTAVMDWVVAQPWSDGRIVGVGNSYTANTADWMAERNHPALKGIAPRFADYDPYADLYFPGGVPNVYMGRVWGERVKDLDRNVLLEPDGSRSPGVRPVDGPDGERLLREAVAGHAAVPSVWEGLKQVVFRDDRPSTWQGASMNDWGIQSHAAAMQRSGTPIQNWAGWMDAGTARGAIHRFLALSNPQRIIIGPWSHGGFHASDALHPDRDQVDPVFGTQQAEDLCFIARCLGATPPAAGEKLLIYYTSGEQRWKATRQWPLPETTVERWYFGRAGSLGEARSADGVDRHAVDFTIGTGPRNRWATNNDGEDVQYGDRADADRRLLTYTSAPLRQALEVTGHPVVTVFLASTHDDGNLFAYLETVAPSGRVAYVTEGALRLLHRRVVPNTDVPGMPGPYHSCLRRDAWPMVRGEVAEITFALQPISVLVPTGHRLRVALSGADADTFARVPAAGDPVLSVHHGTRYGSRIELPIIPRRNRP